MDAVRCSSSLRAVTPEATLEVARSLASDVGVVRVTDITRLDRIGLPVFVSIRPDAERGSVCVNAGKGMRPVEAEVGATMESIELAWAEYRRCRDMLRVRTIRTGDFDSESRRFRILDFCPVWGAPIDLDATTSAVVAEDVATGAEVLVPADAVVHPRPESFSGVAYFSTHSNGLASGNTVLEATVHALAEVLERDVVSFHLRVSSPRRVANETLPAPFAELAGSLRVRGFRLVVHALPNVFGLPAFSAMIYDQHQPGFTAPGDGLHVSRDIALARAITETAQARLAFIHGGRDDLADVLRRYAHLTPDQKDASFARTLSAREATEAVDYTSVPDRPCVDLASAFEALRSSLASVAAEQVLRVVYTAPDYPIQVVRVIVPRLEMYSPETSRIGPRLLMAIRR